MKKKHVAVFMSAVLALNMAAVGYAANQTESGVVSDNLTPGADGEVPADNIDPDAPAEGEKEGEEPVVTDPDAPAEGEKEGEEPVVTDPDASVSGSTSQGGINNTTDAVDGEKGTGIETGSESAEISDASNGGLVGVQQNSNAVLGKVQTTTLEVETEAETKLDLAAVIEDAVDTADENSVSVSLNSSVKYYINDQIILDDGIELTLNLGGAEIDIAQSLKYGIIIKNGSLDISNGTINYNGENTAILVGVSERENIDDEEGGKYVSTGASLTVNEIKLYCGDAATAIMLKGNDPKLVINGNDTEITAEDYFTIATNGSGTTGASIIVNGGKIVSENEGAFYLPGNSGKFVINDGTVQGYHYGVQLASGSFEMNDGEIICTYEKAEMDNSAKGDGSIVDGAAVSFTSREGYNTDDGECSIIINGGTVKSNKRPAIQVYGYNKNADADKLVPGIQYLTELVVNGGTVMSADGVDVISILNDELPETTEVRGGTFSSDVSRYAADGFECTQDEDGNFTVIKEGSDEPENPDTPETPDDTEDTEQETPSYNGSGSSSGSRNESNRNVVSKGTIYADGTTSGIMNHSTGTWKQNETGWWFERTDGSYPANTWEKLSWNGRENWYHFNAAGYLDAGWFTDTDGSTYYLHNTHDNNFGYMYTGWNMINGNYYYFFNETDGGHKEGSMARGMVTPDGYTVNEDGIWTE